MAPSNQSTKWTPQQTALLIYLMTNYPDLTWKEIGRQVGKSDTQCNQKWTRSLRPGIDKSKWTQENTCLLQTFVLAYPTSEVNWNEVSKNIPGKTPKQCKDRWENHADPSIVSTDTVPFMVDEVNLIQSKYHGKGNRYGEITNELNWTIQTGLLDQVHNTLKQALKNPELEPRRRMQDVAKHIKSSSYYVKDSRPGRKPTADDQMKIHLITLPDDNLDDEIDDYFWLRASE